MISSERAHDFVQRGARIRVHSGALGCHNLVMAEGRVFSYCPAPSLSIEHDDGSRSTWSVDLPIEEVPAPTRRTEHDFLAEIIRVRAARLWSQQRLADELTRRGIRSSQSEVSRIERGQQVLLITEAVVLADMLGIELRIGGEPR